MIIKKEKVYELLKQVPCGKVTTYKALAHKLQTKGYRAIGQIVRRNPFAPCVPCHRVVRSDGNLGGYMGHLTGSFIAKKSNLLSEEGVFCHKGKIENFEGVLFEFK